MVRALGVLVEAWGSVPSTHIVLFSAPWQAQKDPVSLTSVGARVHAHTYTIKTIKINLKSPLLNV